MGEIMITPKKIKELLLANDLFVQFRDNPEKMKIEKPEEGCFDLCLDNFPGLNINALNNHAFSTLEIEKLDLSGGYVTSGGPTGVVVRYLYTEKPTNKVKPKF
jgi:hypothetical protein